MLNNGWSPQILYHLFKKIVQGHNVDFKKQAVSETNEITTLKGSTEK